MPTMKKKRNIKKKGKLPRVRVNSHEASELARERVLKVARKRGLITNAQARIIGQWDQAWYHLNAMRKAGLLRREGFNIWRPK